MHFQHADDIWRDFPELSAGALFIDGVCSDISVEDDVRRFHAIANERLGTGSESDLPQIQAWRRTFAKMGLKPTQYRSASEALLRRFRKEGSLPAIHPLIDLCNAASLARDLAAMPSLRPRRGRVLDMFPQTGHYEVVVALSRG